MPVRGRVRGLPKRDEQAVMASKATWTSSGASGGTWYNTGLLEWQKNTRALAVVSTFFERGLSEIRLGSSTGPIIPIIQSYTHCVIAWTTDIWPEQFPAAVYVLPSGYAQCAALFATLLTHSQPLEVKSSQGTAKGNTHYYHQYGRGDLLGLGTGGENSDATYGPGQVTEVAVTKSSRGCWCWSDSVSPEEQYFNCSNTAYGSGMASMVVGPKQRKIRDLGYA